MPRRTWAGLLVLLPILIWAVQIIVVEAIGAAALDSIIERGLAVFGLEKSHMSAILAPFIVPGLVSLLSLFAAFTLGAYERTSHEPSADIDPRQAFVAILKNKKWLR